MLNLKDKSEYYSLYNDLIKFTTILIVLNLLMFISDPHTNKFLGKTYLQFMSYILLGLITYWLVISKIIVFD